MIFFKDSDANASDFLGEIGLDGVPAEVLCISLEKANRLVGEAFAKRDDELKSLRQQNDNFIETVGEQTKRVKELSARVAELERAPAGLHSRSEMRRAAAQKPDVLIAEVERAASALRDLKDHSVRQQGEIERLLTENKRLRGDILKQNYSERLLLAEQERDRLREVNEGLRGMLALNRTQNVELLTDNARLVGALEFYALAMQRDTHADDEFYAEHPLGARARAALEGKCRE